MRAVMLPGHIRCERLPHAPALVVTIRHLNLEKRCQGSGTVFFKQRFRCKQLLTLTNEMKCVGGMQRISMQREGLFLVVVSGAHLKLKNSQKLHRVFCSKIFSERLGYVSRYLQAWAMF